MTYVEAVAWLEGLGRFGMNPGLETTRRLCIAAGHPEKRLRFIHVAGTNGKGSTCAFLESIYRATGLRTGMYTSPHLVRFGERIQVNRVLMSDAELIAGVLRARDWIREAGAQPTFFECTTVMALDHFARRRCDLVIWETGLGGRLDATNVVTPLASVVTSISLDHQAWLGDTVEKIAGEKAGIIKTGIPVITAAQDETAHTVIAARAKECGSRLRRVTVEDVRSLPVRPSLQGEHQLWNAATARVVTDTLQGILRVPRGAVMEGLVTTEWAGRQQRWNRDGQSWLIDGAHNPEGVATLVQTLRRDFAGRDPVLLTGMLSDKAWAEMAGQLAPCFQRVVVVPVGSERAVAAESLAGAFRKAGAGIQVRLAEDVRDAVKMLANERTIVATGSLYFIGQLLAILGDAVPGPEEHRLNEYKKGSIPDGTDGDSGRRNP